jgi:argininosuccinate lyase
MAAKHSNESYSLWGGRFEADNDKLMKMFNDSLPIDKRLWKEDIIVKFRFLIEIQLLKFNIE